MASIINNAQRSAATGPARSVATMNMAVNVAPNNPAPSANQRLGLHVTSDELTIWQDRAVNGPYKTAGDVSTNSPGDWDRIVSNKNTFGVDGAGIGTWSGPVGSSCLNDGSDTSMTPPGNKHVEARDAAFYALVAQDHTVKGYVKNWLLSQQAETQLDFTNRTLWCEGSGHNPEMVFELSAWMNRLIFAMDYIEILDPNVFTSGQRTTLQSWFEGFADFTNTNSDISFDEKWQDRYNDDYTWITGLSQNGQPYRGGTAQWSPNRIYNNRRGDVLSAVANIGVRYNNATFKDRAKLYIKELLKFGVFPADIGGAGNGAYFSDFLRSTEDNNNADRGYQYGSAMLGSAIAIADVLARAGDTELYDYTTSAGYQDSAGGSKSILFMMETICKYNDHTYIEYGGNTDANIGNANFIIDGRNIPNGTGTEQSVGEINAARANLYYQSAYVKSVYMRTASGTVAYPDTADLPSIGVLNWNGHSTNYPAVLFMWGQLEGVVDPFV